ncbi:M23 family metallopeptidase [Anaerotruncus rubiinfantis]|uniref:M23 family metallopeptidase n=1 Tax=Anaerotruncus rubiinfantis TaxID=1720200 RepID=UPI0018980227|nr:M23 family metallopeptidase [Anaerotruncus rubiinfantis]
MSQRLTLPFKTLLVTAGYKHPDYYAYHEMIHYGVDCYDPNTHDVLALGDGEVIAAGQDGPTTTGKLSRLGLVTVIIYRDVLCNNGKVCDLVARTYHHAKVQVKAGDKVKRGQVIAQYGNTGANTTGPHLHIEFDTDTKFPTLAYGVSVTANNRIINTLAEYKRAGGLADSTIDPDDVWFVGEGQTIKGYSGGWYNPDDVEAPEMPQDGPDYAALYESVVAERDAIRADYNGLISDLQMLMNKYKG